MRAAIVIPTATNGDDWRIRALEYVVAKLEERHPATPVFLGELQSETPWSKGRAVSAGLEALLEKIDDIPDVLVIHDADSFLRSAEQLDRAIAHVAKHPGDWIVPHKMVYRLKAAETERCLEHPERMPRKIVARSPYVGPAGGGITVLAPEAFLEVGGIDERFEGWGGEDLAFGWALETLRGNPTRFEGQLFHLWHPHPAPDLRGSPASEDLVDRYREARGYPRRMQALTAGGDWEPLPALEDPVRFRMTANRKTLRISGHEPMRFPKGIYEATDPDEVEALRRHPYVSEDKRRR